MKDNSTNCFGLLRIRSILIVVISVVLLASCHSGNQSSNEGSMKISEKIVGQFDSKEVIEYTLENDNGMLVKIINYGAIVTHLTAADRAGKHEDIVLGFDNPSDYWTEPYKSNCCYLGAIVGRYGNRIANGKFSLGSEEYSLAVNNGPNHLHGGIKGFDKVVWESKGFENEEGTGVILSYLSKDGEEGYPGNFNIQVTYILSKLNELRIDYKGSIDKACPVNITHHGYFNLSGNARTDILDHEMLIYADRFTEVDETLIPSGELKELAGSAMDFNSFHKIGERIDQVDGGYDHNYVLSDDVGKLRKVVRVKEPISGRIMEVMTSEPGVQFYSGNFLDGILTGKGGVKYNKHWGFCLETQHFPDSPNQPDFPNTVLKPGEVYAYTTVYKFSAE
ncbi:MAG: galactose mutarotase [Bacteroidetes bacterium]|jgi:aldose 1-epimerase|nr:galactose mutarotase [Bacteroidota bacterium]MBT7092684.1 galactose mutarotase [Bacteroidota bacterium]